MKPSRYAMVVQSVQVVEHAADLHPGWDTLCTSLLQRRALLHHYEMTNPCGQRYYCLFRGGRPVAGAVVYSTVQNLLTFLGDLPSPVALNVVGLPVSVPAAGLVGDPSWASRLLESVFAAESGFVLALNLEPDQAIHGATSLRLLPDMVFRNRFGSLDDYGESLRSTWRRRMKRSRRRFRGVETVRTGCSSFTPAHHALYLDVIDHATERLETLGLGFFQGLPRPLELVSCFHGGRLLGWRIVLAEGRRFTFVLGGHDYALNPRYDIYFNNLLGVLADGMACGAREIELGQTAEDAKARIGAQPVETRMLLRHGNPVVDRLLRVASPLLAYRRRPPVYRVFRKEEMFA